MITRVARYNLDFVNYCKLVNIFGSINTKYKDKYHPASMFKNMILRRRAGENFPIKTPEELKIKLDIFNNHSGLRNLTFLDILDISSEELLKRKINSSQYFNIVYMILKVVKSIDKRFERYIYGKAISSFKKIGDIKRVHHFRKIS